MTELLLKYPLRAFLDLSTAHVPEETFKWLDSHSVSAKDRDNASMRYWVACTPYGWLVYADEDAEGSEEFPAALVACMKKARELGAEYILFDLDAKPRPDLPVYGISDNFPPLKVVE